MFFNRSHKTKWNHAHKAEPKFYRRGTEALGVFALTESTDTIFPRKPYGKVDNKAVEQWEILLVPLGDERPMGSVKFENVMKLLEQCKKIEQKGNFLYVAGLSRSEMEELYSKSLLL